MVFAVVAGAGFLSGRVVSVRYFSEFGITPSDVGYSTQDSLMTAALLLLIVVVSMVFGVAPFYCAAAAKTFAAIAWRSPWGTAGSFVAIPRKHGRLLL